MKLKVELQNCYGIGKLEYQFNFMDTNADVHNKANINAYAIYAPNGFMKTSFAKTFNDLAIGVETKDRIFEDKQSLRLIQDELGKDIEADSVFVVESYNADFFSERTSLLLVNHEVKQNYDKALKEIADAQSTLLEKLKVLSGLSGRKNTPEIEMMACFEKKSFANIVESLKDQVDKGVPIELADIVYTEVFNDKTLAFLESGAIKEQLEEYIQKYNELVSQSEVLSQEFNHYSASTVHKQLKDNGFFDAQHTINLKTKTGEQRISSAEGLAKKIEEDRKRILSDDELSQKFDAIDKKIQNAELRKFRDYLFKNRQILSYLKNHRQFQKDLWIAYLVKSKEYYWSFLDVYKNNKSIIEGAIVQAQNERTEWTEVVEMFNQRFSVPFTMTVSNQDDVILKGSQPVISFRFKDNRDAGRTKDVSKDSLLQVLSQGEKRALYILNILFELETRRKQDKKTILIIDDIADSFDYKNKYAIIEYLKEIVESNKFMCLFLSHNFDFYRSISERLNLKRECRLHVHKSGEVLTLKAEKYQKNLFESWKKELGKQKIFIAAIPFVRNLAEYCGFDTEYKKLTALLHIKVKTSNVETDTEKSATEDIKVRDLCEIYRKILQDKATLELKNGERKVIDVIDEEAKKIYLTSEEEIDLENKVILSMAIRLNAERHMIRIIDNPGVVCDITSNQTRKLFDMYKVKIRELQKDVAACKQNIDVLDKVNLMTPENIHLNSFMYEPILDLGIAHLKELYKEVKSLSERSSS